MLEEKRYCSAVRRHHGIRDKPDSRCAGLIKARTFGEQRLETERAQIGLERTPHRREAAARADIKQDERFFGKMRCQHLQQRSHLPSTLLGNHTRRGG